MIGRMMSKAEQVEATRSRPLWTIPSSWWLPQTAEAMSDWIKRFVPEGQRRAFTYGIKP